MIGLFDTGHGGLTVYRALETRFPQQTFVYLGDHANAPYGIKTTEDVIRLTRLNVTRLFDMGCALVLLACNTATAVALKTLQQEWLPDSPYKNNRVLGIIAPTVEVATGVSWLTETKSDRKGLLAIFGTSRTILSNVYEIEIHKRCPNIEVVAQICPDLAGGIEAGKSEAELEAQVANVVRECIEKCAGRVLDMVILGCTHFPLVEHLFRRYLPPETRILSQELAVANSLADYLIRHPEFVVRNGESQTLFLTTGDAVRVIADAKRFMGVFFPFEALVVKVC